MWFQTESGDKEVLVCQANQFIVWFNVNLLLDILVLPNLLKEREVGKLLQQFFFIHFHFVNKWFWCCRKFLTNLYLHLNYQLSMWNIVTIEKFIQNTDFDKVVQCFFVSFVSVPAVHLSQHNSIPQLQCAILSQSLKTLSHKNLD